MHTSDSVLQEVASLARVIRDASGHHTTEEFDALYAHRQVQVRAMVLLRCYAEQIPYWYQYLDTYLDVVDEVPPFGMESRRLYATTERLCALGLDPGDSDGNPLLHRAERLMLMRLSHVMQAAPPRELGRNFRIYGELVTALANFRAGARRVDNDVRRLRLVGRLGKAFAPDYGSYFKP